MRIRVTNDYLFRHELRTGDDTASALLSSVNVTPRLAELAEETYTLAVLADQLPVDVADGAELQVAIAPHWSTEPAVLQVEVTLSSGGNGRAGAVSRRFKSGPWVRESQQILEQLREGKKLDDHQQVYRLLVATKPGDAAECRVEVRPLQPPAVLEGTLEEIGVRQLGDGELLPDRPVLVSARMAEEAIDQCEAAGSNETGGAVLGKTIRLTKPLPNTETRIVTVLSTILTDHRHRGSQTRFHISPEALAEAAEVAELRGLGESVLTIFHTHGWGCGDCNQKACPLAECYPSLRDYELESLFPTKALLLPIAGRKHGAPGRRPILQIHAWRGGHLQPIPWRTFTV